MEHSIWAGVGFNLFVLLVLALDLGVFHREARVVEAREAAIWRAVWIALALLFGWGVAHCLGREAGLEFVTGYLIEKALSVDNLFVFVLIFSYFGIPPEKQHRVLFWGIIGALVMRGVMIAAGAALIQSFNWIIYIFGGFLVISASKIAFHDEGEIQPTTNPLITRHSRYLPASRG